MFGNRLRQFMYGRYGSDQLSFTLIAVAMLFSLINVFSQILLFYILSLVCLCYSFFRIFSRNGYKRRAENEWFLKHTRTIRTKSSELINYFRNHKRYKYFKCKNCKAKLRVPRGRGTLTITCPKCRTSFKGKS